jgi:hypothetical protein
MAFRAGVAEAYVAKFSGGHRIQAEDLRRSWERVQSNLPFDEFAKLNGLA